MKDKDNLNNFFKKNLEDYTPDDSWNVPNDDIFLNAMEEVNKDSKPNRKFILLFLFFGIIAALTTFEFLRQNKIDTLENTIVDLEEQIDVLNHQKNAALVNIEKLDNSNEVLIQSIKEEGNLPDNINKKVSSTNSISSPNHKYSNTEIEFVKPEVAQKVDIIINGEHKRVTPSFVSSLLLKEEDLNSQSLSIPVEPSSPILLNINNIPRLFASVLGTSDYQSIDILPSVLDKEKVKLSKWAIGTAVINNVSWLSMTNVPAASENALTAYDQTHQCSGIKISTEYQINKKWSIYGDIGYEGYQNQSDLNTDFFYDEQNVNSDDIFESEIELLNPLGDFSSLASFRVHSSMNQNDVIIEETKIKQSLNVLTLKSGINYTVFDGKRVFGKVGLGVGVAGKVKLRNEFNVSLYNENELMTNYTEETEKMKGVNNFFLMGTAKATIGYKLSDNFNINVESAYNRSLSSLRDSAPANGPQTYLHALSVSTGISYNF